MPATTALPGPADPPGPEHRSAHGTLHHAHRPGSVAASPAPSTSALPTRGRIKAHGVIERITIAPVTASPSFRALARIEWDGAHESVLIVWMGRRRVPGVEAGVTLRFEGMLSRVAGTPTVYNPRYEIFGRPEEY